MAKRLTDTNKWRKPFVRALQAPYKLLWLYILDDCDHAGIWIEDLEVASLRLGLEYDKDQVLEIFKDKIHVFDSGERWFIPSFIDFQYGELNPQNRAHNSVINSLKNHGLLQILENENKALISPLQGAMDKDKDKEKDKDRGESEGRGKQKKKDPVQVFKSIPEWKDEDQVITAWEQWKEYRRLEDGFRYKSDTSEASALKKLHKFSQGDPETALRILDQSISNGWKGLFELKTSSTGSKTGKVSLMSHYQSMTE